MQVLQIPHSEMEEILDLQRQLAAAQLGTTSQKLSERNCVELVMKLQSLNLIDLIFTRSGKEYLTHKQLVIEIEDELLARGGRTNVIDLPDALNVELFHIQSKIPEIIAASEESTRLVRGELLTDYYLASIAEEINDSITSSEHGLDEIGSIASRYALPVDVVRETVKLHLGSVISATLDAQNPDLIRSAASIARDRAAARGLVRAITSPTVLSEAAKERDLELTLVSSVVDDMLKNGELTGSVAGRGNRAIFVPAVYAKAAVHAASSAFGSNGFITKSKIERMYIPDLGAFVADNLSDAIVLNECIVGPSLIDTLATSAAEAVSGGAWLDIEAALPPDIPESDVGAVFDRLKQSIQPGDEGKGEETKTSGAKPSRSRRKAKAANTDANKANDTSGTQLFFGHRFVVSPALSKSVSKRLVDDAKAKSKERARLMSENMSTVVTDTSHDAKEAAVPSDSSRKGKGKGRRRAGAKEKSTKSNSAGSSASTNTNGPPIIVPSLEEAIQIVLSEEELCRAIENDFLGSSTAGDDMLSCLMEDIYSNIQSQYISLAEEAVEALMRERMVAKMTREKELLTGLEQAELYYKATESFPEEELATASQCWVIDEICTNSLCRVVDAVTQGSGIFEASIVQAHSLSSKKEKMEVIRTVLPKLAPPLETKLRTFVSVVSDKGSGAVPKFLELYDENTDLLDLPARRPLDSKRVKVAHTEARTRMKQALKDEDLTGSKSLVMATALVHASGAGGVVVQVPPDAVMGFCKATEERSRPSSQGDALSALREAVEQVGNGDSDGAAEETRILEIREKVAVLLATLV